MDELSVKKTSFKWQKYQKCREKPYDKRMEKIVEEAVQRSEGRFTTADDDDTDSVASSRSSVIGVNNMKRKTGVSPLNRRKSLRLAMKKESTMQIAPSLQSQNTVIMQSPPMGLQRMETSTRWTHHRGTTKTRLESQETVVIASNNTAGTSNNVKYPNLPRGTTKWVKHRGEQLKMQSTETIPIKKSKMRKATSGLDDTDGNGSLLKKMSTTWGLRKMLGNTKLNETSTGKQQALEGIDEVDSGDVNHTEQTNRWSKLKRKASQQLSVIEETSPKKGILRRKKTTKVSKQVTVIAPNEEKPARKLQPKRQLSLASSFSIGSDECLLNRAKRMKIQQSVNQHAEVYFPSERNWPVHMNAQVIWDLPLIDESGQSSQASSVYVNSTRCVISQLTGTVIQLNSAVVPTKKTVLPAGVNVVKCVENKVIVGCSDGGLYDVTNHEPQLLWKDSEVGEIMKIAAIKDQIAIGGKGKLALLDGEFKTQWLKEEVEGATEDTWLVAVDNNVVYHGQCDFITKTLRDGSRIWQTAGDISCKPCGAEGLDYIYVSLGNEVAKVNKYRGITEKRYAQGSSLTNNIHSIEVGGGLLFAAGNRLVCYHEETGEIVFVVRIPNDAKIVDMQYFQARLFCLSEDCLRVLDFTENSVKTGMDGNTIGCTTVSFDIGSSGEAHSDLTRDSSFASVSSEGSTVDPEASKPKPRRGKLKVKALTIRNNRRT